jgi:hypothetical protein
MAVISLLLLATFLLAENNTQFRSEGADPLNRTLPATARSARRLPIDRHDPQGLATRIAYAIAQLMLIFHTLGECHGTQSSVFYSTN